MKTQACCLARYTLPALAASLLFLMVVAAKERLAASDGYLSLTATSPSRKFGFT